jgi:hypothetical protein
MYTSLNFKAFPLVPLILGGVVCWRARPGIRRLWDRVGRPMAAMAVAFLVTCSWMIVYGIQHPLDVVGRPAGVSFLTPSANGGQPVQTLVTTIVKTALMFNVSGDQDYKFNLAGSPELPLLIGVAFLVGLVLALFRARRMRYLALLTLLGVMLLPEVLSAQGIPHSMRAIGAMPAALILAALGTDWLIEGWYRHFPIRSAARATGLAVLAVLLAGTAYGAYREYFVTWAQSPQTYQAFASDTLAIAMYLDGDRFSGPTYVVIGGYADQTIAYLTRGHSGYTRISPGQIGSVRATGPTRIVIDENDVASGVAQLHEHFPVIEALPAPTGFDHTRPFLVYEVGG